ncbi:hypothetical protein PHYSODRAFT_285768 [Phytophthora sojae]|uniref:RxLR effector protein n=2 Tax=Phytophthora sojae TaxID=67593 RepID=G4ZAH2_PHYSP|nr:hypothetical protein PHYSODRAFT_285768 [Phytophthora sojae]AEK81408.1 RxL470 [Phytophthora sojae]AEK81409.1 RxL470 [Phytophthora sojae]AEK81410.1 RxL470 [Phytophthora sojae]EGZ22687.1 hypothetical protein PHYSODRAFT_285768 [Phytophthora sojae]|eukprot:XP_009525404.1 hypothetical protein PHYSODRAFT_285768 [Phytophthora sojae]
MRLIFFLALLLLAVLDVTSTSSVPKMPLNPQEIDSSPQHTNVVSADRHLRSGGITTETEDATANAADTDEERCCHLRQTEESSLEKYNECRRD